MNVKSSILLFTGSPTFITAPLYLPDSIFVAKTSSPPRPGWPSDEKYITLSEVIKGKVSLASVFIVLPKFSGVPNIPSAYNETRKISDCPNEPGISEAKYNVFPSGLKAGCAVEYESLLKGNSSILVQTPSTNVARNNLRRIIPFSSVMYLPSLKLLRVK